MAIRTYFENGKKLYEVYVNGFDSRGIRTQRKRGNLETLRKAETVEFELKRDLAKLKEEPVPFRWHEWFDVCMNRMKVEFKPSTIMNYQGQLKKWTHPVWRMKELGGITPNDVHDLIYGTLGPNLGNTSWNTKKSVLKMVKRIFQMAVEDGVLQFNPALRVRVKVPEVKQAVLNSAKVQILLLEANRRGHKFYEIWTMALLTGMRSGELYALRWTDVDLNNRRITVSQSWCSKNGFGPTKSYKARVVPISDELLKFLKELKLKRNPNYEFVLPHIRDWTMGDQAEVLREFCSIIGITSIKFHDLRATFITQLLLKGVSLAQVMAIVGHSQIKTTNVYLRMTGVDLTGATDKLGFEVPDSHGAKIYDLNQKLFK